MLLCATAEATVLSIAGDPPYSGIQPASFHVLYFNAVLSGDRVDLSWATTGELNNDLFEVQRTVDGITFETVAVVAGCGTSTSESTYHIVDNFPRSGASYYRLKKTDANGLSTCYDPQMISYEPKLSSTISVCPNPSDGTALTVNVPAISGEQISITIYGADGKAAHVVNTIAGNDGINAVRVEFPLTLAPGMYFADVTSSNGNAEQTFGTQKIIVR